MPDQNRSDAQNRNNVNENEDMQDGSSQGVAPTGSRGTAPGTYGGQGEQRGGDQSATTTTQGATTQGTTTTGDSSGTTR